MSNYRNPKLLRLANQVPYCMHCGALNTGQVVACHSNWLTDGKGMGYKAHDLPAYLCDGCHAIVDRRLGQLENLERMRIFYASVYRSVIWLLQEGHLEMKR